MSRCWGTFALNPRREAVRILGWTLLLSGLMMLSISGQAPESRDERGRSNSVTPHSGDAYALLGTFQPGSMALYSH